MAIPKWASQSRIPSHPSPVARLPRLALNPEPCIKKTPEAYNLSVGFITVNSQSPKCPYKEHKIHLILHTSCIWGKCTLHYLLSFYEIHSYLWLFHAMWIRFVFLSCRFHLVSSSPSSSLSLFVPSLKLEAHLLFPLPHHRL